jgi:RHS repeat-associated protein
MSGLTVSAGGSQLSLALASVVEGGHVLRAARTAPTVSDDRVVYRRPGVTETDVNGPAGVEQTFVVDQRSPKVPRRVVLTLNLGGTGLQAVRAPGDAVKFETASGKTVADYTGLAARDARGRPLAATMRPEGGRIVISVATRHATFPIDVDPYIETSLHGVRSGWGDAVISGDTMVVGFPFIGDDPDGSYPIALVLTKPATGWASATVVATLSAPTDDFALGVGATTVAISGSTIAVGTTAASPGDACGAVYVYTKPDDGWSDADPTATLTSTDCGDESAIGGSVAISGDTIVTGDPNVPANDSSPTAGGAFVFAEPDGGWSSETQTARLYNTDSVSDLGWGVAIDGTTVAVVGEGDEIDEYTEPDGGWSSEAPTAALTNTDSADLAGTVAADDDAIVAPGYSNNKAYVYVKPMDGWADATQTAALSVSDSGSDSSYLYGIDVSGTTIAAAAPSATVDGVSDAGAVYVWDEPEDGWSDMGAQTTKLTEMPDGFPGGGGWVSISGSTIAVSGDAVTTFELVPQIEKAQLMGGGGDADRNFVRCAVADPVDCATGNFYETQTDLSLPGRGAGIALTRTYNSQAAAAADSAGMFGYGWTSSYSDHLAIGEDTDTVIQADGSELPFTVTDSGLIPSPGVDATLVESDEDDSYTFTLPNQDSYLFNSSGELESETDEYGNTTSLTYTDDELTKITDAGGRWIELSYNDDGTVSGAEDSAGRTVSYSYTDGDLMSVTTVTGGTWAFGYDDSNRMTSMTDPDQNETTNMYDDDNRVTEQTQPGDREWTWSYPYPDETVVTDPKDNVTDEYFNGDYEPTGIVEGVGSDEPATTTYTYDDNLDPATITDPNSNTTTYSYDASGNKLSETDPLGRTTAWTYYDDNNVHTMTAPNSVVTTYSYSGNDLTEVSRPLDDTHTQITYYAYDDDSDPGAVTEMTDPDGNHTMYSYDSYGDLTSVTDGDEDETTYAYNSAGQRTSTTSPDGNVTGANAAQYTTDDSYDAAGDLLKTTATPSPLDTPWPGKSLGSDALLTASAGPWGVAEGSDGNIWVAETGVGKLARVKPDGTVSEFSTGDGSAPIGLISGPGGDMWFTDGSQTLGKMTTSGSLTSDYNIGAGSYPNGLAVGPSDTIRVAQTGYSDIATVSASDGTVTSTSATTGNPWDIVAGTGGADYFSETDPDNSYIGSIDSSGTVTEYALAAGHSVFTGPNSLGFDPNRGTDGTVWFLDEESNEIGAFDVATHDFTYYPAPADTSSFDGLTLDVNGNVWFTQTATSSGVGELDPNTGQITEYPVDGGEDSMYGIAQGAGGDIYIADNTTNDIDKIASGAVQTASTSLPNDSAGPWGVAEGPDGNVWAAETSVGYLAQMQPDGTTNKYSTGDGSAPLGLISGPGGDLWFTDGSGTLGKMTTSGTLTDYDIGAGSYPTGLADGPSGTVRVARTGYGDIATVASDGTISSTSSTIGNPWDIVAGTDGNDYFTETNDGTSYIGSIDSGGTISEYALAAGHSVFTGPNSMAFDPSLGTDGVVWFLDTGDNELGKFDVDTHDITYYPAPADTSDLDGLTLATDGTVWFTQTATSGGLAQYDPSTGLTTEYPLASPDDNMYGLVQGANGDIYAADNSSNSIDTLSLAPALVASYTYDSNGNQITATNADGQTTSYTYDGENELAETTEPDGTTTSTTYDADGNVHIQTDGRNQNTTYTYNALNQRVESEDADSNETFYTYDGVGNLLTVKDPEDRTTTYTYDADNELTDISYSDGTTHEVTYPAADYNALGEATEMTDATGTTYYTYDAFGRLTSVQDGNGDTTGYTYDLADNETAITYPGGDVVNRTFDAANQLHTVEDWLDNTTTFAYDADGNLTDTTFAGSAGQDNYTYDNQDGLASSATTANGATVASLNDTYDPDGNLTQETSTGLGDTTQTYGYNSLDQLDSDTGGTNAYDPDGNPTSIDGGSTLEYDDADQLESGPGGTYDYNTLGQRTSNTSGENTTDYAWDQAGNLTGVTGGADSLDLSYQYDGNGLLQNTTNSDTTTQLTWDTTASVPLLIKDGSTRIIYGPDNLPLEQIGTDDDPIYYHHDQLGSTRLLTNADGDTVETINYSPYGTPTISSGTATTALLYAGDYTDPASGLVYMQARWYDPSTAQFLSVDPLVAETDQSFNYAGDNPVVNDDPTGLCTTEAPMSYAQAGHGIRECAGVFTNSVATVFFKRGVSGRLYWDFYFTKLAYEQLGPAVLVSMPFVLVNGSAINPPYSPHAEPVNYDFHSSFQNYQVLGGGGTHSLKTNQTITLYWLAVGGIGKGAYRYITCRVPPPGVG